MRQADGQRARLYNATTRGLRQVEEIARFRLSTSTRLANFRSTFAATRAVFAQYCAVGKRTIDRPAEKFKEIRYFFSSTRNCYGLSTE